MKIEVKFKVKSHPLALSDQTIDFVMKNSTKVYLKIERESCFLTLEGKDGLKEIFYAIWELLAWNNGYFYEPVEYIVDGCKEDEEEFITRSYCVTDEKWKISALLIGRANRDISEDTITRYMEIRNKGRKEQSMNKSMFSSYFCLISKAYANVNLEHRLVLLMHICDGFAIQFLKGTSQNNIGNINTVLNQLDIKKKYKEGADKLGVSKSRAKEALGHTRNELTHYEFQKSSLGSFISDPSKETDNMVYLYAFYILDLALRVSVLETIGAIVEDEIKEYLLDEHLDWIRLEKHLEEDCVIPRNVLTQMLQRLQEGYGE